MAAQRPRDVSKSSTKADGERYVIIGGIRQQRMLHVVLLASSTAFPLTSTAEVAAQSFLNLLNVLEMKVASRPALIMDRYVMTACMMRMSVSLVMVRTIIQ